MLTQLWTIAVNTLTESIRQPIYVVLLLLGSGLLAINPLFSAYTLEDDNMLLIDLGMSTMLLAGLFLAAFTATSVLSAEIENRTVLTVISKPIARPTFLLGKYLGVLVALAIAEWVWMFVFLLTIRHRVMMTARDIFDVPVILFGIGGFLTAVGIAVWRNYVTRHPFGSSLTRSLALGMPIATLIAFSFDRYWKLQSPLYDFDRQILVAMLLLFEAIAVLCAVAVTVSTRLGQVATLTVCVAVFLLGLTSDYFFGPHVESSVAARAAYTILPNLQYLWVTEALTQGVPVSLAYVVLVSGYSALYIVAIFAVGTALFESREVG